MDDDELDELGRGSVDGWNIGSLIVGEPLIESHGDDSDELGGEYCVLEGV